MNKLRFVFVPKPTHTTKGIFDYPSEHPHPDGGFVFICWKRSRKNNKKPTIVEVPQKSEPPMYQLFSDPGKKTGTLFWGWTILVGQPPKRVGKLMGALYMVVVSFLSHSFEPNWHLSGLRVPTSNCACIEHRLYGTFGNAISAQITPHMGRCLFWVTMLSLV